MIEFPISSKSPEFVRIKLWAIVGKHSVRDAMPCKVLLQFVNNSFRCCTGLQPIDFPVVAVVIYGHEVMSVVCLKQINTNLGPWPVRYLMWVECFLLLGDLKGSTSFTLSDKVLHSCVHSWPENAFSRASQASFHANM